jgi:hypothetical protein
MGVSRTANVSLGENLKYRRNISKNTITAMRALCADTEYRCPTMKTADTTTIKLGGRIAQRSAAIRTIAILVRELIYPSLLLIIAIEISARRNFHT